MTTSCAVAIESPPQPSQPDPQYPAIIRPCQVNMANPAPHLCLTRYREFAPPWISQLVEQGWAEVEHRAWGFPLPKRGKLAPTRESDFMDPGAAGMWYVYRRGSGIFYRMGRTKTGPGKNDMLASLLQEAHANSSHRFALDAPWRSLVTKAGLFDPEAPTSGLLGDAGRILAAANGSLTCGELGLRACRCTIVRTRYAPASQHISLLARSSAKFLPQVLGDEWDDALIWLARALRYDTLLFHATLIGYNGCPSDLPDCSRIINFKTA